MDGKGADCRVVAQVDESSAFLIRRPAYEIKFNRYFCRYTPPRPREEIEADIRGIEQDIVRMLVEEIGARPAK